MFEGREELKVLHEIADLLERIECLLEQELALLQRQSPHYQGPTGLTFKAG